MKLRKVWAFTLFLLAASTPAFAYWVWSPEKGEFVNPEGGAGQGAAQEQFDYAMKFYNEKNLDESGKQFEDIVKKYPQLPLAGEALYRLGTIYEEKADYLKAFRYYQKIVESYPNSERFTEVVEREFRIGNIFLSGRKAKIMGLEILPSLPKAAEVFESIVKNAPYSEFGDKAQFHLGLAYKQSGKYEEAVEAFQAVIDKYPQSELVTQARYQVAETAYDRSSKEFRDQRALDEASKQVDRFLDRYPDTGSSEKAAKLRQAIDEKNAEKNYRIGVYYEKEKYLQSAIIYYSDAANRYPQTSWGQKAAEKMKVLKSPTEYRSEKEQAILKEVQAVEQQLKALPETETQERARLQGELDRLGQQQKDLAGKEREGLKSKAQDLKRREGELKEKFKKLEQKRKLFKSNTSEDFQKAMERWHASLVEEREALEFEKTQMGEWEEAAGMGPKAFRDFLPFVGEPPTELEKIRRIDAKKLYKISKEKAEVLEKKEKAYRDYEQLAREAGIVPVPKASGTPAPSALPLQAEPAAEDDLKPLLDRAGEDFKADREKLLQSRSEIERLEKELNAKSGLYEENYGRPGWLTALAAPARALGGPAGYLLKPLDFLNPFGGEDRKLEELKPQELVELRQHLKEQASVEQNMIDSLSQAFDTELALQEQKRIMATLESKEKIDPAELRKSIKGLERDIRQRYEEISDRHERKRELLKELDIAIGARESERTQMAKTGRVIAAPAVAAFRLGRAFLFGMKHEDEQITNAARRMSGGEGDESQVKVLKDQIELESIVIEAKSQEITKLRKELEILRAKASLAGGFKFRSSFVRVPYGFLGEAVASAKRIVPKKDREEILIERLNDETAKLERIKGELKKVEDVMSQKGVQAPQPAKAASGEEESAEPSPRASEGSKVAAPAVLKEEIQALANQLEVSRKIYEREKTLLSGKIQERDGEQKTEQAVKPAVSEKAPVMPAPSDERGSKKQMKKLEGLREDVRELIGREQGLEGEEQSIIEKRVEAVDRAVAKISSRAAQQDLLTEKQRMEERLSQLQARRGFLAEELKRF
ncbi:MAG: outer membrane protein assembly factor BamD [Candidatus Omnitrophota bacterium]|jgi:outer membrane assembly lipoprotein YfiO